MAYAALEKMQKNNEIKYGKGVGPKSPELMLGGDFDMKLAALKFLHSSCEDLRFDIIKEKQEEKDGLLLGTSAKANQIPINMQMV